MFPRLLAGSGQELSELLDALRVEPQMKENRNEHT